MLRVRLIQAVSLLAFVTFSAGGVAFGSESEAFPKAVFHAGKVTVYDFAPVGGSGNFIGVGEQGMIIRSTDDGKSWQTVASIGTRALTSVSFQNERVGVAVGHGGTILHSEDGGRSWRPVANSAAGKESLLRVSAMGETRFLAYGAYGLFLQSDDQGKTWTRKKVISDDFDRHISEVIDVNGTWLLVGESGTIATSRDFGTTWSKIKSPYVVVNSSGDSVEGSFFGVLKLKSGAILIYGMRGNVFRSEDGGGTWTKSEIPTKSAINGGSVDNTGKVLLVGNNGLIASSTDDGRSFSIQQVSQGTPIAQARTARDGSVIYVGLVTGRLAVVPQSGSTH